MKTSEAFSIVKMAWEKKGATHASRDGRALFMYKELPDFRYHISFSYIERFNGLGISFDCSFIPNELGTAVNFINQEEHRVFPFKSRKWQFYESSASEIGTLAELAIEEAEHWISLSDFHSQLQWLLSKLSMPGSHQLWHVAALALTGEISVLRSYRESLGTADRGGLYPYIEEPTSPRFSVARGFRVRG